MKREKGLTNYLEKKFTVMEITKRKGEPGDQFISTIRGLYFAMNFFGLWPAKPSLQYLCDFIWFVQTVGLGFAIFGPVAGIFVHRHDTRIVIDIMGLVFPMGCTCLKWVTLATRRKPVDKLLRSMAEDWNNFDTLVNQSVPDSKLIMLKYSRFAKIYFLTYITMMSIAITYYIHDSISSLYSYDNDTDPNEVLMIPNSWYPLDYQRQFNVQFLVVTQAITASETALANAAIDSILVTITLHLCGQLKILRCFIESIRYDSSKPQYCETKMRLMAKRHQELLSVGNQIQESYSYIILVQSMACTLTFCFLGYALLAELDRTEVRTTVLIKVGFICGATLQTMFSFCHVGDCLLSQSIAVATAIYNAEWFNFTGPINSSCLLVMIRARRPVALTGATFVTMSLETFTSLLKAAGSYLSVLRAMDVGQGNI